MTFSGGLSSSGDYEARLFFNDSYNVEATAQFSVDEAAASITTSKPVYQVDEVIEVDFSGAPGNKKDWIGLFPEGGDNYAELDWYYTDETKNGTAGITNGTVTFSGGLSSSGDYEARLFFNDSYNVEATDQFSVTGGPATEIYDLPATSSTGSYTLKWRVIGGGLVTNVSYILEDSDISFPNPTPYWTYSGERSYLFTDKPDGTYWYMVAVGGTAYSAPASITVSRPAAAPPTLRLINNSHYYMVDIQLNGSQQLSYPDTINPSGGYHDFEFTSPGTVDYHVGVGFYDTSPPYTRDIYWTYTGQTTLYDGETTELTCNNPTISQFLCNFQTQKKFGGYYYDDQVPYWCYFIFYYNGSWKFYDKSSMGYTGGNLIGSGTITEVSWPDHASVISFRFGAGGDVIYVMYPFGSFKYKNGPPDWPIIEYIGQ
ncbi:hypothetical protein ES703_46933 [subsurface metagenome]